MIPHPLSVGFSSFVFRSIGLSLALTIFAVATVSGHAEESSDKPSDDETSRLKLKADRVVVFKDGYSLIIKRGVATTDAKGNVFTDEVPDSAVLGSFWVVPDQGTIKQTVAGWVDTEKTSVREVNCTSLLEIVQSNLGKECRFIVGEQPIEGTLLKVLLNGNLPSEHSHDAVLSTLSSTTTSTTAFTTAGSVATPLFVVRTQTGDKVVNANSVIDLTIANMDSSIDQTLTTQSRHKRLTMKFAEPNANIQLNLMYFRPDVRWIPTYRLNLTGKPVETKKGEAKSDRKMAELILQGELLNEAEDLIDVPFHVVVGVPNFRFRALPSPMVLEATMRNVLTQAAPDIMGMGNNAFSNGMYSQRASEFRSNQAVGDPTRTEVDLPDDLVGKGGNDLFVYELPAMTLKRGERAMVPILRTEAQYRDIYTWDIELVHSESYAATSADAPSPLILSETKVWRQVELINNTNIPWTTGAAMVLDGTQPLAQELLTYTSPGGICRVPVTVSVDLRGKAEDTEVNRVLNAVQWRGSHYARVEGKIEAELANNKNLTVPVEVRLRFGGKATEASDDAKIKLESFRATDWINNQGYPINNSSEVRWTTTIEAGECFKPTVKYEFFLNQ
jgi:hypothetical protein